MLQRPHNTLLHDPIEVSSIAKSEVQLTTNGPVQAAREMFQPEPAVMDPQMSEPVSLGTTILAVTYKDGVILAADSRTSSGSYVVNRSSNKLTKLTKRIYCCRSGSAADTQALAERTSSYLASYEIDIGRPALVVTAANIFQKLCYWNKWNISAGIIVAGYDDVNGGSVYSIPSGASMVKLDYALGGSGSIFLYSFFDVHYKSNMSKQECLELCQRAVAHAYSRDGSSGGLIRTMVLSAQEPEDMTVVWKNTPYCMEKDPKYAALALQNPIFASTAKISENKTRTSAQDNQIYSNNSSSAAMMPGNNAPAVFEENEEEDDEQDEQQGQNRHETHNEVEETKNTTRKN